MSETRVALPQDSDSAAPPAGTPGLGPDEGQPQPHAEILPELECSVGVMAYNEEANIAHALDSILRQELTGKQIREVIVVASGCQDRTVDIVADIAGREPRVRLIEQVRREGKASAINLFIGEAKCPVLVMVGADLMVEDGAFDFLLRHFEDPAVGMVGGHPIPVNGSGTFLGMPCTFSGACTTESPPIRRNWVRWSPSATWYRVFRSTPRLTSFPSRPSSPSSGIGWCTNRERSCTTVAL